MTPRDFWDRYLRAYDALNRVGAYRASVEHLARTLDARPGERILDAGSGTGNLAVHLKEQGSEVVGLDFSPVALRIHREKDPSATVVRASLEEPLPFPDRIFDLVVCAAVLFALSDRGCRTALGEFRRVLRPRGRVVITAMKPDTSKLRVFGAHVGNLWKNRPLGSFLREMRRTLGPLLKVLYYNYRMHGLSRRQAYRRFTAGELVAEVERAGFVRVTCESTFGGYFHLVRAAAPDGGEAAQTPTAGDAAAVAVGVALT
jgi:ubiquinone/menaquinone biosynthesis C-methylase UbiE